MNGGIFQGVGCFNKGFFAVGKFILQIVKGGVGCEVEKISVKFEKTRVGCLVIFCVHFLVRRSVKWFELEKTSDAGNSFLIFKIILKIIR